MIKKYVFAICIIIIISSCGPSRKVRDAKADKLFDEWIGHSKAELIQRWGQPDSTFIYGKNKEVLIYKEKVDYKSVMNGNYTGTQFSFRKEMYINADSAIFYWKAWRRK